MNQAVWHQNRKRPSSERLLFPGKCGRGGEGTKLMKMTEGGKNLQ